MENEKQRERLVELLRKSGASFERALPEEISDYLIANNVVVTPCKVGDTVHSFSADFGVVLPYLVGNLNIGYMGKSGTYWNYEANCHDPETDELLDEIDFEIDDIGKTVFLSRSEAEAKLKEMQNGGN